MNSTTSQKNPAATSVPNVDDGDERKFVLFRVGSETYGTRLLEVQEVVEAPQIRPVPNTIRSFRGVCNLRGQIIGVIDLRMRFDIVGTERARPVMLVFDSDGGAMAALVDEILSVSDIPAASIETKANIISAIPMKYITGIGRINDALVTILDLKQILSREELTSIQESKIRQIES
jgi:purine-binding chemotaxis protein CheW